MAKTFKTNSKESWDRQYLKKMLTNQGQEVLTTGQALEQFSAALVVHENPFNQKRSKNSAYSSTSPHTDIGAWPLDNLGPSGFGGGILAATPGDITDSGTSVHYQGYKMDYRYATGAGMYKMTASASGVFSWSSDNRSFPDAGSIGTYDLVRDIGGGVHISCFVPPGATSAGTIHAYICTDEPASEELSSYKAAAIEEYHAPVSQGVTLRVPCVPGSLEWATQISARDSRLYVYVIIEWDGAALPTTWSLARYVQHKGQSDLGPRQINLDEAFTKNVISIVDYGSANLNGHMIEHVPLIVSGHSFWATLRNVTKNVIGTVLKTTKTISEIAGAVDSVL